MGQAIDEVSMKILFAAKKLFARKGFYDTTIRDICREAGVHVMMHSYNFRRKENVLIALFQVFLPLTNIVNSNGDTPVDPVEGLKRIIREIVTVRMTDPEIILILQHEITLPSPRDEIVQYLVKPLWIELKKVLIEGKSMGLFRFDSLDITMTFIISSVLLSRQWEFFEKANHDSELTIDFVTEGMSSLILSALSPQVEIVS
ncbi:TetR family transcriptional regulator [Paenibacillus taihuensis]|uniref:TetR family transcriptional regulator n=1 Tax=Paenibacillus taihuensis TaxID=1156355 RepID=A0A3D9R0J6_9BACL|nr:TetR family transcriptional regulator [Paenibacillus taihuensis]REE67299.1 TetR family transcriptional regulator [Paenibacillus taihuensis]